MVDIDKIVDELFKKHSNYYAVMHRLWKWNREKNNSSLTDFELETALNSAYKRNQLL